MTARKIIDGLYYVGAIDWDRTIFDALIPIPSGTSYNSYLLQGNNKVALIDTVEPEKERDLIRNLESLKVEKIDYIIANHAEQDHSGSIPVILKKYPGSLVVTNAKCKEILMRFLPVEEDRFMIIEDGQTLDLGGRTLKFIFAPWVHWPETMFTFCPEEKVLFSCDFLGSHLATSDLYSTDRARVLSEAKRYYAQIMMPFSAFVKKHIEVVFNLAPKIIAPSHGPIHNEPQFMIDAYRDWTSDKVKNEVLLGYISMHGSTEEMVNVFTSYLMEEGVAVRRFNMLTADLGEFAAASLDAATVCLASPAVLVGAHPNIIYAAYLLNLLKPKTKFITAIGSYSWGSKLIDQLKDMLKALRAEFIEPVQVKGYPTSTDDQQIRSLAKRIVEKHKEIGAV